MKSTVLVDIGIIVEYLKTGKGVLPTAYEKHKMLITPLTYAELLASSTFTDENLEKEVMEFVNKYFEIVSVEPKAAIEISRILRQNDLTMVSAVNAAVARVNKVDLLTDDKKTYKNIDGVQLTDL